MDVSQVLLNRLQLVLNASARLLTGIRKKQYVTPILASLHWLPLQFRIDFKLLIFEYKALHNLASPYLVHLLHIHKPPRSLRSANQMILDIPRTVLKLSGNRAFAVEAPKRWNNLPLHLRQAPSLGYFKRYFNS